MVKVGQGHFKMTDDYSMYKVLSDFNVKKSLKSSSGIWLLGPSRGEILSKSRVRI